MTDSRADGIRRQLRLDGRNGWLGGVCAGMANYFGTDPAVIRVGVIVTGLFLPKLVIAGYLIAWLLLDDETRR